MIGVSDMHISRRIVTTRFCKVELNVESDSTQTNQPLELKGRILGPPGSVHNIYIYIL
jgi:hypothetical protein